MLRRHLRQGQGDGSQRAVIHFERPPFTAAAEPDQVVGLGLRWFNTGRTLRRRWHAAFPHGLGGNVVYHNAWGIGASASEDGAGRRLVLLHSRWPGADALIRSSAGLCDGWICVSEPLRALVKACLPDLPDERLVVLPVPVDCPLAPNPQHPPLTGRPLVLGYSGRLIREAKRVDRLPRLDVQLRKAGLECCWEILGDGPAMSGLKREMPGPSVCFRGRVGGDLYWEVLSGCDVLVFTSDYEGMPISLLEALSCGVLPLFPRIGSGADDYVARIAPELLYRPGDLADAARGVRWIADRSFADLEALRRRASLVAAPHAGGEYDHGFLRFLSRISALPRISADGPSARRRHPGEWVPFALVRRLPANHWLCRGYV
jgi:glycosyltransferase involved in cell wall biosynthesis